MTARVPWRVLEHEEADSGGLERDWLRIYASMPLRSVYHSLHAHRLYARHLMPPGHRLRYFALHDGEQVRAICPLEATVDHGLGVPVDVWATPYNYHHWPFSDVICAEDAARAALIPALTAYLRETGERRLLMLGPVPTGSMLWNGLAQLPPGSFCAYHWEDFDVFNCTLAYDELLGRMSARYRRDIRRREKKLNALPGVTYMHTVAEPDLSREFETFLDLEASGWKADAGNVIKMQPGVAAFYRGLLTLADAGDHVMLLSISLGEHRIASQFDVRTGGQLTGLKTAYDESYAHLSPGVQLMRHTIEYGCADPGIAHINLIGTTDWMERWQPDAVPMGRAYFGLAGRASKIRLAALSLRYGPMRPLLRRAREEFDRAKRGRRAGPQTQGTETSQAGATAPEGEESR